MKESLPIFESKSTDEKWNYMYRNVKFQIRKLGYGEDFILKPWFCIYLYIEKSKCYDFESLLFDDYSGYHTETILNAIDFNQGVTFYEKIKTRRDGDVNCLKVGCDYNHLSDSYNHYSFDMILRDAELAVDSLFDLKILK